jgi:hypothetical protein
MMIATPIHARILASFSISTTRLPFWIRLGADGARLTDFSKKLEQTESDETSKNGAGSYRSGSVCSQYTRVLNTVAITVRQGVEANGRAVIVVG